MARSAAQARRLALLAQLAQLAWAAGLAGCAVGPNYAPPQTPAPTAPGGGAFVSEAPASPQPPPAEWWKLYDVPALDALVQEALVHNNNLLQAAANLAQARGALSQARAGLFPSTTLSAGVQHGVSSNALLLHQLEQPGGLSGSAASSSVPNAETYYSYGLDVSYEVDLFGRIRRGVRAAKADVEAQQAAEDVVRVTVAAETTRAYVNACAYAQQLAVAHRSLDIAQQQLDLTQNELVAGSVSDFDVARQRALVEQTRAALPGFEGQRRTALFQLAVLTGRPPEDISRAADACAAPPKLDQTLPVGDAQALFRRRPDVRQAERQLAANVERIGVATADLYPTITIAGSAQESAGKASRLTSPANLSWLVGPLISWSFPNTLVAQAEIRQARGAASASLANFQQTVLQALQDTEDALTAYGAELRRNAALAAALRQEETAYRLVQIRFRDGSASSLDLLTTETDLVNAQAALASSDQAVASDQVTVFKALGGGWEQAPGVTPLGVPDAKQGGRPIPVR